MRRRALNAEIERDYNTGFSFAGLEPAQSGEFGRLRSFKAFSVLHVNAGTATSIAVTSLPATLVNNTLPTTSSATVSRTIYVPLRETVTFVAQFNDTADETYPLHVPLPHVQP